MDATDLDARGHSPIPCTPLLTSVRKQQLERK